jgi:hypothetical protein
VFDWLSYNFKIRLCCFFLLIFLIGILENGEMCGKKRESHKKKKSGVEYLKKKKTEIVEF